MIERILVARTDKLGDFMLTWYALAMLRGALPDARIDLLVGDAVADMAEACPYANGVMVDQGQSLRAVARDIRHQNYDAAIAMFSNRRTALALARARIPYRLAPATKIWQLLFNQREVQRRSRSDQPEYRYNADLAERFLQDHGFPKPSPPKRPLMAFPSSEMRAYKEQLRREYGVSDSSALVIVHPGSGGSANNLSAAAYAGLVNRLKPTEPIFILITAGPGEREVGERVMRLIDTHPAALHASKAGLLTFAHTLACADVYISGSTGPLHVAGALDVRTAGFYPRKKSSTARRWQTMNSPHRRLAFSPPADAPDDDMGLINLDAAAQSICDHWLND